MLFLISYQQIMLSSHCDTSIRVSIILLWVSIPGENEVAQMVWMLQQLATSRLPGRADSEPLMECLTCKHLGHLPPVCFFPNEAPESLLYASKGSFNVIITFLPLFSFLINSKSLLLLKCTPQKSDKRGNKYISCWRLIPKCHKEKNTQLWCGGGLGFFMLRKQK